MKLISLKNKHLPAMCIVVAGLLAPLVGPGDAAAQHGASSAREYVERTEELLLWAADLVGETDSGSARKVLGQAQELHRRSKELMMRERMVEAVAVARRARDTLWHAVRVAREAMGLEEKIRVRAERFTDQHRALTERAREARNEPALQFLERARAQADRARDQYRQGDHRLAWKLLEQAGELLQRAARLVADGAGPERLEREMERAREAVNRTAERLGDDARPHQRDLLAEATETLARAVRARDEGRPGRALQLASLAEGLAERALGRGQNRGGAEAVERQLERFDERAGRIGDVVREAGDQRARRHFDQAIGQRNKAAASLAKGATERALRELRAAHDLLTRAEDLVR